MTLRRDLAPAAAGAAPAAGAAGSSSAGAGGGTSPSDLGRGRGAGVGGVTDFRLGPRRGALGRIVRPPHVVGPVRLRARRSLALAGIARGGGRAASARAPRAAATAARGLTDTSGPAAAGRDAGGCGVGRAALTRAVYRTYLRYGRGGRGDGGRRCGLDRRRAVALGGGHLDAEYVGHVGHDQLGRAGQGVGRPHTGAEADQPHCAHAQAKRRTPPPGPEGLPRRSAAQPGLVPAPEAHRSARPPAPCPRRAGRWLRTRLAARTGTTRGGGRLPPRRRPAP